MADNLNTPFLGQPLAADNLNTASLAQADSAATQQSHSILSTSAVMVFNGAVTLGGTTTQSGAQTISGAVTQTGAWTSSATVDLTSATLLSRTTTASADSTTVGDGELAVMESTNTNVTLIYRSGNTTYHWVSSAGSVG